MSDKVIVVDATSPPAHNMHTVCTAPQAFPRQSHKTKLLFGYAVAVTTTLIVVIILSGIFYFRSQEVLLDTIKIYHRADKTGTTPVHQDIEVNTAKNTVVFHLNGEGIETGTFAVLDYAKSMTGIFDPEARACYLIGGIQKKIADLKTFSDVLEKNVNRTSTVETLQYQTADTYPVNDKAILPSALKSQCAYLPVYWLEPATETKTIQKRAAVKRSPLVCFIICGLRICRQRYSMGFTESPLDRLE
jgi:ribosomal silencing factor RsfS